jgi:ParB family chromosome partitioning protein
MAKPVIVFTEKNMNRELSIKNNKFPEHKVVSTDSLIPYAMNSRTHSEHQIAQIAASIKEFGFLNPIIVDGENGIIAGHGRVMAAQKIGLNELPVVEAKHLTDAQRRAYVIADNKLALNADWDYESLRLDLESLKDFNFNIELAGFSEAELSEILFDNESESDFPHLNDGEKEPYQQKAFVLHDEQVQIVDDALTLAKTNPCVDTGLNENTNGNAISLICEQWLKSQND